ncbi:MAG: molybdopterin molybdotransferase MoeA [Deltaproteobacteria bacterium]|nr:molybdopterin molybdotransferase MoeA [Deltaproteobacteria bacterium]
MRTGISVPEARAIVLEQAHALAPEIVAFEAALGRVLAEEVRSDRTLPPADCSAMDGYAVRGADVADAGAKLHIAYEVAAGGAAPRALAAGEAARIFTGAPIPRGADTVVRQEDTEARADEVRVLVSVPRGESVRASGEDVRAGDLVLSAGVRVSPAEVGMLASLGRTLVHVHRRPTVAVLSGGDELVEPHETPTNGRIVSSNAYSIAAQCLEAGALPNNLGIARDTPADLERLLRAGLGADVLVSSAGVSVGDHDHVRPTLEKLGVRLFFWGVEMKPGYPITFGRAQDGEGAFVFGLPGNPVSAMVTFELFVRPLLLRLGGRSDLARPEISAVCGERFSKKPGREHYVRVFLEKRASGDVVARTTGNQSSGVLRSMTLADGLLVFPADASEIADGGRARVIVLDASFFAR